MFSISNSFKGSINFEILPSTSYNDKKYPPKAQISGARVFGNGKSIKDIQKGDKIYDWANKIVINISVDDAAEIASALLPVLIHGTSTPLDKARGGEAVRLYRNRTKSSYKADFNEAEFSISSFIGNNGNEMTMLYLGQWNDKNNKCDFKFPLTRGNMYKIYSWANYACNQLAVDIKQFEFEQYKARNNNNYNNGGNNYNNGGNNYNSNANNQNQPQGYSGYGQSGGYGNQNTQHQTPSQTNINEPNNQPNQMNTSDPSSAAGLL